MYVSKLVKEFVKALNRFFRLRFGEGPGGGPGERLNAGWGRIITGLVHQFQFASWHRLEPFHKDGFD